MGGDITTYSSVIEFLELILDFFTTVFQFQVVAGISLGTVLLYNFLIVAIFSTFARRS